MRRLLRGVAGTLLAGGLLGLARPALAQPPFRYQGRPAVRATLPDNRSRLEEMKVEMALLADIATFPYYLGGRVSGETLEVCGYVPDDTVRRRALEIASRVTFLKIADAVTVQPYLSARPAARGVGSLVKEAEQLLGDHFGAAAKRVHLSVRTDGVVSVTGSIDSIEDKLAVSKLFRQLPGCAAVVNNLAIELTPHDGQRVVQVTRDGSLTLPPPPTPPVQTVSTLPAKETATASAAPSPLEAREGELGLPRRLMAPNAEALKPPAPVMKWGQSAMSWESKSKPAAETPKEAIVNTAITDAPKELIVPAAPIRPATKTVSKPIKKSKPIVFASDTQPAAKSGGISSRTSVALTAPPLPARWQRPGTAEESEPKTEAAVKKEQLPTAVPVAPSIAPPRTVNENAILYPDRVEAVAPPPPSVALPIAKPAPAQLPTVKPVSVPVQHSTAKLTPIASPMPLPVARPLPSSPPVQLPTAKPAAVPLPPAVPPQMANDKPSAPRGLAMAPPPGRLDRPSRWPPAYEVRPPEPKDGHPGVLVFEEEPAPKATAVQAAPRTIRPVAPAELKKQVQAVCGRKARDVAVEVQRDGSLLVRVRVAGMSEEDQLTRKILAIPQMTAPNVRLVMDVGP